MPGPTAVDEHKTTSAEYGPPVHSWTGEIYQDAVVAAIQASPTFLAAGFFGVAGVGSADARATGWFESTTEECLPAGPTAQVSAAFPGLTLTFGSNPGVAVVVPPSRVTSGTTLRGPRLAKATSSPDEDTELGSHSTATATAGDAMPLATTTSEDGPVSAWGGTSNEVLTGWVPVATPMVLWSWVRA
jgi:hypothetical protein